MAKRNLSATIQIGAKIAPSVASSFAGLRSKIDALGSSADKLKKASSDVEKLAKATAKLDRSRSALGAARKSGDSAAIDKARTAFEKQSAAVEKLRNSLKAAGVDTRNLSAANESLARSLASVQTKMQGFARLGSQIDGLKNRFITLRTSVGNVGSALSSLAARGAIAGTATGLAFNKFFLESAISKESMDARLSTVMGGEDAGKKAFSWIQDFTNSTPYGIQKIESAFVKLKNSGLDPTNGTLQAIADQTAAVGGNSDSMEGIARALGQMVTNTRITAEEMNQLSERDVPAWDLLSKAIGKSVKETRELSEEGKLGLKEINMLINEMGARYEGSAMKMSKTWTGLMSRMGNKWFMFSNMVMSGGTFDFLKSKLDNFFESLTKWEKDGTLKKWAEETSNAFGVVYNTLNEVIPQVWGAIKAVKEFVGGWQNLGIGLGAVALAPTITSLVQLGAAVAGLLGPWGLLVAGVFTGVTALIAYREEITGWLQQHPVLMAAIQSALGPISNLYLQWQQIADAIDVASTAVVNFINAIAGIPDMQFGGVPIAQMGSAEGIGRALVGKGAELMAPQDMPEPGAPVGAAAGAGKATRVSTADTYNITVNAPGADAAGIAGKLPSYLKAKPLSDTTTNMGPK